MLSLAARMVIAIPKSFCLYQLMTAHAYSKKIPGVEHAKSTATRFATRNLVALQSPETDLVRQFAEKIVFFARNLMRCRKIVYILQD